MLGCIITQMIEINQYRTWWPLAKRFPDMYSDLLSNSVVGKGAGLLKKVAIFRD